MTLTKLYIVNFAAAAFLAWAWVNGLAQQIMSADSSHMGVIIMSLFAAGVVSVFWQTHNAERAKTALAAKIVRIKSEHIVTLSGALFVLGVIGNAKGLLSAFKSISTDSLTTAEGAQALMSVVLTGISSTFGATIIGCTFGLWTIMNAQILYTKLALLELESP